MQQIGIGAALGFLMQMAFNALIFGGQGHGLQHGPVSPTWSTRPTAVSVPVVAQFWLILAMLAFLMMNGHLVRSRRSSTASVLPIATDSLLRRALGAARGHRGCSPPAC